jgi:hypothetical protein
MATNSKYVSSVLFLEDRELLNKVLDIHNEDFSFLDVMELSGRSAATTQPQFFHMVNEEMYGEVTTDGNGVVTAGRLRSGDICMSGSDVVYVQSIAADGTVTLTDLDGGAANAASVTLFPFSNAFGEGSGAQESLNYGFKRYGGQVQIFKGKFKITDVAKTQKMSVAIGGSEYYMYKGQHDALQRFRNDISLSLMFGKANATKFQGLTYDLNGGVVGNPVASTGNLQDKYGNPVQTADGLDAVVAREGIQAGNGVFTLDRLADLSKTMDALRAPSEYMIFCGSSANIQIDNVLNGLTNVSGADVSKTGRLGLNGKSLDLGIDTFRIYGRTYHKKYLPMIEHAAGKAVLGSNASNTAYFAPVDQVKVHHGGETQERMMVRYLAGDGTDLRYKEILLGGLAPTPTSDELALEVSYSSAQGLQLLGTNVFAKATFSA